MKVGLRIGWADFYKLLISMIKNGGQGQNRTADTGIFSLPLKSKSREIKDLKRKLKITGFLYNQQFKETS